MPEARYNSVAVALHWAIAILILGQIAGGLVMEGLPNASPWKFHLYQLHKSVGLTIFALTFARLGWRLTHKVPALPAAMPGWQKVAARAIHWGFYALLILTPLAGWALVSVSPRDIPTVWFGLIEIPHLPFFEGVADRDAAEDAMERRHKLLSFTILFLLALHLGAALKHGFLNRDGVLRSMAPAARAWIGIAALFALLGAGSIYSLNSEVWTPGPGATSPAVEARESAAAPETGKSPSTSDEPAAPEPGDAPNWIVDASASSLRFVGEEGGRRLEGAFSDFTAQIRFDENALDQSWVRVEVRTASGATGDILIDLEIAGNAWFDVEDHPAALFVSDDFRHIGGDSYEAAGALTIKEFTQPVTLAFTLAIDGDAARATGSADLIRTDFGLGENPSWLEEENVALEVIVEFEIAATRAD